MAALSLWEADILLWIQSHLRNPFTDPIVSFFTQLGNAGLLFIALTLLLLAFPKTRRLGLAAGCALVLSLLFTNVLLKHLVGRVRPWVDFPSLVPLVYEGDPNSFPSGHSSAAFAFAAGMFFSRPPRWLKISAPILALLMALSRLYVGVHYPTDVAAGIAVGILAGWLASRIVGELCRKWAKKP